MSWGLSDPAECVALPLDHILCLDLVAVHVPLRLRRLAEISKHMRARFVRVERSVIGLESENLVVPHLQSSHRPVDLHADV